MKGNLWLIASCSITAMAVTGYIVANLFISNALVEVQVSRSYAGIALLVAIIAFDLNFIAAFITSKMLKVIPILNILISLIIGFLADFAYWFSGYALHG